MSLTLETKPKANLKDLLWQVRDLLAFMEAREVVSEKEDMEPRVSALEETLNELDPEGGLLETGKPRFCACLAPLDHYCEKHFGKCCDCLDKEEIL